MKKHNIVIISTATCITLAATPAAFFLVKNEINKGENFNIEWNKYMDKDSNGIVTNEPQFLDFTQVAKDHGWSGNQLEYTVYEKAREFGDEFYKEWYNGLSLELFTKEQIEGKDGVTELFCNSERQALMLYTVCWGHFWNMYLQQGKEIPEFHDYNAKFFNLSYNQGFPVPLKNKVTIRGSDENYLHSALSKVNSPINLTTYHGVEFMETEIYKQLKPYIKETKNGKYDFTNLVNKVFTSPGYLSTSMYSNTAFSYSNGMDWSNPNVQDDREVIGPDNPPFKVPVVFKINVPENAKGVAFVSNFHWLDKDDCFPPMTPYYDMNGEAQLLIDKNSSFRITKTYVEDGIQVLEMTMLNKTGNNITNNK